MSSDVTGFCESGNCSSCDGRLKSGTGHHWWCAHSCHVEPEAPNTPDGALAKQAWQDAR